MDLDRIAYIYTHRELSALLRLVGCGEIPFFWEQPGDETLPASSGLAERSGEHIVLDSVAALFAKTVGECRCCTALTDESRRVYIALMDNPLLSAVLEYRRGRWIVTPFERHKEALEYFIGTLPSESPSLALHVRSGGRERSLYPEKGVLSESVRKAVGQAYADEFENGGSTAPWKQ